MTIVQSLPGNWLDTGDNAWQLTAATFVGIMSVPGLALLYGGAVKKKFAINSAFMVFYAFSMVLIVWVLWAYNMSFGKPWFQVPGGLGAFLGHPDPTTSAYNMEKEAIIPSAAAAMPALGYGQATMVYFQFVFAAITPIILLGAILGRVSFKAWVIFVPLLRRRLLPLGRRLAGLLGRGRLFRWLRHSFVLRLLGLHGSCRHWTASGA
jgi:Amt family ammonium transporter